MNAIPIKVQCGCGQKYAFDVEPVAGQMPGSVACPVCGADGTSAANMLLAQHLTTQRSPAAAHATPAPMRVAMAASAPVRVTPAAAPVLGAVAVKSVAPSNGSPSVNGAPAAHPAPPGRPMGRLAGQMDETQARAEARAKILWGDDPDEVSKFLRIQGLPANEAKAFVDALVAERTATIRSNGVKKIIKGIALVCVPIAAGLFFLAIGYFPLKIFAVTVLVGLYGLWELLKGLMMFIAPKGEPGDVSEQ